MDVLQYFSAEELTEKEWKELLRISPRKYVRDIRNSLKENNRFFVEFRFIKLIIWYLSNSFQAKKIVQAGNLLYRARFFDEKEGTVDSSINTPFHGYNKKESYVPPASATKEGRANPENIVYLYTASEIDIAIAEIAPNLGDVVNIAEIEVLSDLTLLDLRAFPVDYKAITEREMWVQSFVSEISSIFQTPYHQKFDYLFCQYVCELAKNLGMDGIAFYSSKTWADSTNREMGINIVVFDSQKCTPVASELYIIRDISIDYCPFTRFSEKETSH